MRYTHYVIFVIMDCAISVSVSAHSAFDGFRLGIEATYSETALEVNASNPKGAAVRNAYTTLTQDEAQLAASSAQVAERRIAFEAGTRHFIAHQQLLSVTEQQAAINPQAAVTPDPLLQQMRQHLLHEAASLQAASEAIKASEEAIKAGEALLMAGQERVAELSSFPAVSTVTLPGTTARVSLGWGTSWATRMGGIYYGVEIDAAPGVGDAVVRVPNRYDTRVEGGLTFGAAARFGWVPVPWAMPYVTIGMETQKLRIERSSSSGTEHFTGFRTGFGVEFSVEDNNIIRVGYDRTMAPDSNFAGAKVTPLHNTYHVGLVRRF